MVVASGGPQFVLSSVPDPYTTSVDVTSITPEDFPFPDDQYHPVIAKALLVQAASWGALKSQLSGDLNLVGRGTRRRLTQLLGYGLVSDGQLTSASSRRVVLIGASTIKADQRHIYRFPLPPSLKAVAEWKRLTVTLAWISATNPRTQKYRVARLKFGPPGEPLNVESKEADATAMTKGTLQHQVLEGSSADVFEDGGSIAIDVDCRIDVGSRRTETRYGLAVSLEVGSGIAADIHSEVRAALRTQLQETVQERIRPQG